MRRPSLSVVTVCRNAESTLEETIQSVATQSFQDREVIVIDGGSTNGTTNIIKSHTSYIDHWISEPDGGVYDAMNKGIAQAKGDWIHLLNADDYYYDSDTLKLAVGLLSPDRTNYFAIEHEYGSKLRKKYRSSSNRW